MKTIISSYRNQDMDGTAAMFALKELFEKTGEYEKVGYYIFEEYQYEVKLVLKKYGITLNPENVISKDDKFILVDCNDLLSVDKTITPDNIIEVIDHHELSDEVKFFKNAKLDIQKVGAMATLVVERFVKNNITPSFESAVLLYHAIASNTINLKGSVTTQRDLDAFAYMERLYSPRLSSKNIEEIFTLKSRIDDIENTIFSDLKILPSKTIIGQLEIANVSNFYKNNVEEIETTMNHVKEKYDTSAVMLNLIDIVNGYNIIYCPSGELREKLSTSFGLTFDNNIAISDKIIMRKQIVSAL